MIETLKPYLMGWRGYFGFCQTPRVLTNLEAWIRRRLRRICGQWTVTNAWSSGRGLSKDQAAIAAGRDGVPHGRMWWSSALRNHHFDSLGLPRL